ncbi:hypothetical protein AF335_11600 [Streptomyces eurocidicus]|uniref:Uncharacterized protein n=1 Tax=Streptomyces eurocidicus TaxID=66423 RepID=A0A2N8NXL6_STREU|nr:hypothetical protein [Streptomyces eurocidicus]MBB5120567.1 hypothetical protein [Streptomyces eurocidicus]MBF6053777.1 hypothetical protein [Streptomyces eurocidicus]PNE33507.1 hypothetical protein AF335_11600 [Streptomyces eurocidicus]
MSEYHLWLAAVPAPVPEDEARIYWNLKDLPTPVLDGALERAAFLHVGSWRDEHQSDEPRSGRCPARRIFERIFFLGTIDRYRAPLLDTRLRDELLRLHAPRPGDLPAPAADADALAAFLTAHLGRYLLPEESPPSLGGAE